MSVVRVEHVERIECQPSSLTMEKLTPHIEVVHHINLILFKFLWLPVAKNLKKEPFQMGFSKRLYA